MKDYPKMIREICIRLDCSLSDLSFALGVSYSTLCRWEGGKCKPPSAKAFVIKEIYSRNPELARSRLPAVSIPDGSPRVSPDTDPPTAVPDAAKTHHLDAFIAERCAVGERHIVRYAALWAAYLEWCAGNKVVPLTQRGFRTALNSRRIVARPGAGNVAMRVGIALFPIQKVEDGGI